jgi:hypothetical protein
MPPSGRPPCGFGSFCAETSLLVIADEDIKRRMRAAPAVGEVTGRDGYWEAGEWQQAGGDQRDRAAQKVFARADPENRAAISISARPPIITVIGTSPVGARLNRDELPTVIE